jgi:transcriptional regulator with XRE-family HTH domain
MTPAQFRAARALLDMTMQEIADECGLAFMTVGRYQAGVTVSQDSIKTIRETLERLGIVLIDAEGENGEGVRFKRHTGTPGTINRTS